jgi:uncharacterized repeat protein (TIGR02543 family)
MVLLVTACIPSGEGNVKTFTITFSVNATDAALEDGQPVAVIPVMQGGTLVFPSNPTRQGFSFDGWFFEAEHNLAVNQLTAATFADSPISSNITVFAKWSPRSTSTVGENPPNPPTAQNFWVTFNPTIAEGGLTQRVIVRSYVTRAFANSVFTAPAGFVLDGWFYDAAHTQEVDFTRPLTADITFFAKWAREHFTVTYLNGLNSNDIIAGLTQHVAFNDFFTTPAISSLPFVTNDYNVQKLFLNFVEVVTVDDVDVETGNFAAATQYRLAEARNIRLRVVWEEQYAVSFTHSNPKDGGSLIRPPVPPVRVGAEVIIPSPLYDPPNFRFAGFEHVQTGDVYQVGQSFLFTQDYIDLPLSYDAVRGAVADFEAIWLELFTVSFAVGNTHGATVLGETNSVRVVAGEAFLLPAHTFSAPAVLTFLGWEIEQGDLIIATIGMPRQGTRAVMPLGNPADVVLWAVWGSTPRFTTTFVSIVSSGDDEFEDVALRRAGDFFNLPSLVDEHDNAMFTRLHYTFAGWQVASINGVPQAPAELPLRAGFGFHMPAGDVVFAAQWTPVTFRINYLISATNGVTQFANISHGSNRVNYTVENGVVRVNSNQFSVTGYTFVGFLFEPNPNISLDPLNGLWLEFNSALLAREVTITIEIAPTAHTLNFVTNTTHDEPIRNVNFDSLYNLTALTATLQGLPERSGYEIAFWRIAGGEIFESSGVWKWTESSLTVEAVWSRIATAGLSFALVADGTYGVEGYVPLAHDAREVVVPSYFNRIAVTAINTQAFLNNTVLQTIVLPETLLRIEAYAFTGSGLRYITLPNSLTSISDHAFFGASELLVVTAYEMSLLHFIGAHAFANCINLRYVKLPAAVSFIGAHAFAGSPNAEIYSLALRPSTGWASNFNSGNNLIEFRLLAEVLDGGRFKVYYVLGNNGAKIVEYYSYDNIAVGMYLPGTLGGSFVTAFGGAFFVGGGLGNYDFRAHSSFNSGTIVGVEGSFEIILNNANSRAFIVGYTGGLKNIVLNLSTHQVTVVGGANNGAQVFLTGGRIENVSDVTLTFVSNEDGWFDITYQGVTFTLSPFAGGFRLERVEADEFKSIKLPSIVTAINANVFPFDMREVYINSECVNIHQHAFGNPNTAVFVDRALRNDEKNAGGFASYMNFVVETYNENTLIFNDFEFTFAVDFTLFAWLPMFYTDPGPGDNDAYNSFWAGFNWQGLPASFITVTIVGYRGAGGVVSIPEFFPIPTTSGVFNFMPWFTQPDINVPAAHRTNIRGQALTVGQNAFRDNYAITQVSLPSSIREIAASAFENCVNLTAINLHNITVLGEAAFAGCRLLREAVFENNNLTVVGARAFENNFSLREVRLPSNVAVIGARAFANCTTLANFVFTSSNIRYVGASAFENCTKLRLGNFNGTQLVYVGGLAFYGVMHIGNFAMGENLSYVGDKAFAYAGITAFAAVGGVNPFYAVIDGILYFKNQNILVAYPSLRAGADLVVANTTVVINAHAFAGAVNLRNVLLPFTTISVEDFAFKDANLTVFTPYATAPVGFSINAFGGGVSVVFGATAIPPAGNQFEGMLTFGDFVYFVEDGFAYIVRYTGNLVYVIIPTSLNGVDVGGLQNGAFLNQNVRSVFLPSQIASVQSGAFANDNFIVVYTNAAAMLIGWHYFENVVYFAAVVNELAGGFQYIQIGAERHLTRYIGAGGNVVVPSSITHICTHAFAGAVGVTAVEINGGVVGNYAFRQSESLVTVTVTGAPTIGYHAFRDCWQLLRIIGSVNASSGTGWNFIGIANGTSDVDIWL